MTTMRCPVCQAPFQETVKEGILIDTCTQCRGVWLDRGELEKLLGAMRQETSYASYPPQQHSQQGYPQPYRRDEDDTHYRHGRSHKKSTMERLFDIFD